MADLRRAAAADGPFLLRMVRAAVNWDPTRAPMTAAEVAATPSLAHYVDGWPRGDDLGVIAEVDAEDVGAAWLRHFPVDDPGYGFVSESIPEVSIAVVEAWRGQGVGGQLLDALAAQARAAGLSTLSLSVEARNPAARLYRRHGYCEVHRADGAITMRLDL